MTKIEFVFLEGHKLSASDGLAYNKAIGNMAYQQDDLRYALIYGFSLQKNSLTITFYILHVNETDLPKLQPIHASCTVCTLSKINVAYILSVSY